MMEKKIFLVFFLMGLFSFGVISCSDDSDNPNPTEADKDDSKKVLEWSEQMKTDGIVQELCTVMTQDDGTVTYEPRVGKVLYEVSPTTYYQPVSSLEEAEQVYYRIISPLNTDSVGDKKVEQKEITQGDMHLKFEQGSSSKELARIIVDCPRLRDVLTEIVFMSQDQWPENDMTSPFNFLSVWKQKSTNNVYLCIRRAQGSHGILLTFDGGYEKDEYRKYDHWQGKFYVWKSTAKTEDIEVLAHCVEWSWNELDKAWKFIPKGTKGYDIIRSLLYNRWILKPFDTKVKYDYWLWWAYHCYGVTIDRTRINADCSTYSYSDYYKHEDVPIRKNPSHAIYFNPNEYWEYKVEDTYCDNYVEKKIKHSVVKWDEEKKNNWERLYVGIK